MTAMSSPISLCPINFQLFDRINSELKNIEATLLYSRIRFHQQNSKITKLGNVCIVRSRDHIATWFNLGIKKSTRLLRLLEDKALITKVTSLWHGKKRLFISTKHHDPSSPVNIKLLDCIAAHTGCVRASLIFSKIAFAMANTKIEHEGKRWCCLNKTVLASWSGLSIRTLDRLIDLLQKKGLILKQQFSFNGKSQTHYHIPIHVISTLQASYKTVNSSSDLSETTLVESKKNMMINTSLLSPSDSMAKTIHNPNCRSQPAKRALSIKIRSKEKHTNNNTSDNVPMKRAGQGDITFTQIGQELSLRQLKYLESALLRTINRRKLSVSNPKELWEQLKFALINPEQRGNTHSFQHAVSRFMKILGDGNWKTPIGFHKHSAIGQELKAQYEAKIQKWNLQKDQECQQSRNIQQQLGLSLITNLSQDTTNEVTQKALKLAMQMRYIAMSQTNSQGRAGLIEDLSKQLHGCIRQGANKEQVMACLRG